MKANIYKITSPSGRVYVGSSVNVVRRFREYKTLNNCKGQIKLFNSFKKHGVEAHIFEILAECEVVEMYKFEAEFGEKFDVLGTNGLNLALPKNVSVYGGLSQETKDKIGAALKGRPGMKTFLGKKHSKGTKNKMSIWQIGRTLTPEHCENISLSKIGTKASNETKRKKSVYMLENSLDRKIVLNLQNGIFYDSAKEASGQTFFSYSYFKEMLNGGKPNKTNFVYA